MDTVLTPIIIDNDITYRYYTNFDSFALSNYGDQWFQDQEVINLAVAEYQEYWTNRSIQLFNTYDGYDMLGATLDKLATTNPEQFHTAMLGYAYYEEILQPGDGVGDVQAAVDNHGNELPENYEAYDNTFEGNFATPFAAMSHYLFGEGEDMNVSIRNLGLEVSPNDVIVNGVNALDSFIYNDNLVGTAEVNVAKFAYNTADDSVITGAYIGNMSLKLEGDFTRFADGSWEFNGELRGYSDLYDFNPSTHRSWAQETFTNIVNTLPGTAYDINIQGSLPVHWDSSMDFLN